MTVRRAARRCSTSRSSRTTCSAGASPTPTCSGCSAARWPRRRWSRRSARSTTAYVVHSLHSYFLRPGDTSVPIIYDVEDLRDGRSFATRRVVARQHGRPIYYQTANFQVPEDGPRAPGPDARGDPARGRARPGGADPRQRGRDAEAWEQEWAALDVAVRRQLRGRRAARATRPAGAGPAVDPGRREGLPDDPLVHLAAFTYASDMTLLGATLVAARRTSLAADACWPRWTTRSGSTGRSAPTSGGSTTRTRPLPRAAAGSRSPGVHPGRAAGRDRGAGGADPGPAVTARPPTGNCDFQRRVSRGKSQFTG